MIILGIMCFLISIYYDRKDNFIRQRNYLIAGWTFWGLGVLLLWIFK